MFYMPFDSPHSDESNRRGSTFIMNNLRNSLKDPLPNNAFMSFSFICFVWRENNLSINPIKLIVVGS